MNTKAKPNPDPANQPVHEIRLGRIKASVWQNDPKDSTGQPYMTVTFSRLYKNEKDEWRDSKAFFASDLLLLAKTADAVHSHLCAVEGK